MKIQLESLYKKRQRFLFNRVIWLFQNNESKAPKINLRSYNASEMFTFLDSAGNLTGAQAACASINSLGRAVNDSLNSLYIGLPSSV